jgi:hypothetical protein
MAETITRAETCRHQAEQWERTTALAIDGKSSNDEAAGNCSKNKRFMNSRRREPYGNARRSDGATGRANY